MKKFQQKLKTIKAVQFGRDQSAAKVICSCDAHTGPHIHRLGGEFGSAVPVNDGDWLVTVGGGDRTFRVISDKMFKAQYEEVAE